MRDAKMESAKIENNERKKKDIEAITSKNKINDVVKTNKQKRKLQKAI